MIGFAYKRGIRGIWKRNSRRLWIRTFRSSRIFWQTIQLLRKKKQEPSHVVLHLGGELLSQIEDIVGPWKEHFEDLLNSASMFTIEESEDLGEDSSITLAEVIEVVKKLPSDKAPGVNEIFPEMLQTLVMVGLFWLTCLFNVTWRSESTPVEWQTEVVVPIFRKVDRRMCKGSSDNTRDRKTDLGLSTVMRTLFWSVVIKRELSRKAKLSIYLSMFVPTLTYGHEICVVTKRTRFNRYNRYNRLKWVCFTGWLGSALEIG